MSPALLVIVAWAAIATVPLVVIDIREHRLPNAWTYPGWIAAFIAFVFAWFMTGAVPWAAVGVGAAALAVFFVLALGAGLGVGDVKLAVPLAVGLGLHRPESAVVGLIAALLLGGIAAALAMLIRRKRGMRIPFGPWLLAGFWLGLLA